MAASDESDDDNVGSVAMQMENILYDLTIQAEWQQEAEPVIRAREKCQPAGNGAIPHSAYNSAWGLLRIAGFPVRSSAASSLPTGLETLVSTQLPWQVAVSRDGSSVAILQDQALEMRSSRDDFASVVGRCVVARDSNPQWRHLAWSSDASTLAYAASGGQVALFDLVGTNICTIQSSAKPGMPLDLRYAISALLFTEPSVGDNWHLNLLVITYGGCLQSYAISRDGEPSLSHTFDFSATLPMACVGSAVYHQGHRLLLVGSSGDLLPDGGATYTADELGVSAWRILSGAPHYKHVTDYESQLSSGAGKRRWLQRFHSRIRYKWNSQQQDGIYKLCLSPDEDLLSAVHYSGRFSLFDVPSLRVRHTWPQSLQPSFDAINQSVAENPKKRKQMKEHLKAFFLNDTSWWTNESVILSRGNGAVSVCLASTLHNQLGTSPEWFEPLPALTSAHHGGFLALECESKTGPMKRRSSDNDVPRDDGHCEEDEDEEEEEQTLVSSAMKRVSHMIYLVTESERFQPPRKRPKLIHRTYRLVMLKSTTPEQLYTRKIQDEEYGEALALARSYDLDCDRVYQRQWRSHAVSITSIHDYLGKIGKRSWVLHECLGRVPSSIDAMRELLLFGLRGTQLPALTPDATATDRFMLCDLEDAEEESFDDADKDGEEKMAEVRRRRREDLLAQIDFDNLLLTQQELCRIHLKLLRFLDRLSTYEEILGGLHVAEDHYDAGFFETFRSRNIVEAAVDFARACDWRAVDIIFTYHGADTLEHRLAILSNFPETFCPSEYRSLLPEVSLPPGGAAVAEWECQTWRDADWCETSSIRDKLYGSTENLGEWLYRDRPELTPFRGATLTRGQLTAWYAFRAAEIEAMSRQVDYCVELVGRGLERGVQGLDSLRDDLLVMETLVYDCLVEDSFTLKELRAMSNIDRVRLMMSKSSAEMYVKNARRWLLPLLGRIEAQQPGSFRDLLTLYLVSVATDGLHLCLRAFEASKADAAEPLITDELLLMELALQCIYAYEGSDQLNDAFGILECLPQRGFSVVSPESSRFHDKIDELECHLSAAEILEKHSIPQTVCFIRNTQNDAEEAKKLFVKLTRVAGRKVPSLTLAEWRSLLSDLLMLREKSYRCVQPAVCYEIFVESLLTSGNPKNIALAGEMMNTNKLHRPPTDGAAVDYEKAIELVLCAAHEYFDSAANLTDSSMELARNCLALITDRPDSIAEELDLIKALSMLDGFAVAILPIQVRMCEDRLALIEKAVEAKPLTYKNSYRLLQLAQLMRVSNADEREREGRVLKVIAQTALKAGDHQVALQTCERLVQRGYGAIWAECVALAEVEQVVDIAAKMDLLSFAVSHCTPDMIEPVLRAKCLLETQILYDSARQDIGGRDSASPDGDPRPAGDGVAGDTPRGDGVGGDKSPFSPLAAFRLTAEFLSPKSLLAHASDTWRRNKALAGRWRRSGGRESDVGGRGGNEALEKQACHPFYADLMAKAYVDESEVDYGGTGAGGRDSPRLSEVLLRAGKLSEMLTEGTVSQPASELLIGLAKDVITTDVTLGLAYLLALPQPLDAAACLSTLPVSAVSLHLASYFYSLSLYALHSRPSRPRADPVYRRDPDDIVRRALRVAETLVGGKGVGEEGVEGDDTPMRALARVLLRSRERLTDYGQAQVLCGLGRGVDVDRFTTDEDYKRETILGLAMCLEADIVKIAESLAARYDITLWEVKMTHVEFLFDSEITTDDLEKRLLQPDLLTCLTSDRDGVATRVCARILPGIRGTDHARLGACYALLEACGGTAERLGGVSAEAHVKLLRRIRTVAPDLDYRKLVSGSERPLTVIQPILTAENVAALAKLAPKIPDKRGGFLQASVVYCARAARLFWQGDSNGRNEPSDWIHRFESCSDLMQKLLPEDLTQFSDAITFVPEASQMLSLDTRAELVRRTLKYSRQTGGKRKKRDQASGLSWDAAADYLQASLTHLDLLTHPTLARLRESNGPRYRVYAQQMDLSRSEPDKVRRLVVSVVMDGETVQLASDLLDVVGVAGWTGRDAVTDAVTLVTAALRGDGKMDSILEEKNPIDVLHNILQQVANHQKSGGSVVVTEDVMSLLRSFCSDAVVPENVRLRVLEIVEQLFDLPEADLVLLVLYRTQALVLPHWRHLLAVEEKCVSSEEQRSDLFNELLEKSTELVQFSALLELLKVWPTLQAVGNRATQPSAHPWCRLVSSAVSRCGDPATPLVFEVVRHLQQSTPFSVQCLQRIFDVLVSHDLGCAGATCLLTGEHSELYGVATCQLIGHTKDHGTEMLYDLIVERHLVADIVDTVYFHPVVEHLLSARHADVPEVATRLRSAGHDLEAGSLLLRHREVHPLLRTLDMAIDAASRWQSL